MLFGLTSTSNQLQSRQQESEPVAHASRSATRSNRLGLGLERHSRLTSTDEDPICEDEKSIQEQLHIKKEQEKTNKIERERESTNRQKIKLENEEEVSLQSFSFGESFIHSNSQGRLRTHLPNEVCSEKP